MPFLKDEDQRYEDPLHEFHYRNHTPNAANSDCSWCVEEFLGDDVFDEDFGEGLEFDVSYVSEPTPVIEESTVVEESTDAYSSITPDVILSVIRAMAIAISGGVPEFRSIAWAKEISRGLLELDKRMQKGEELPEIWQDNRIDFPQKQLEKWAERSLTNQDIGNIMQNMNESAVPGEIWDLSQPKVSE